MRTTELVLIAMVMLGCFFKYMHWPGASAHIFFGRCGLALFYFPFGFRSLPAPKPTDQILWMSVLGGFAMCIALLGLVSFLMRWPNNSTVLLVGAIACAPALITGGVLRYKHPHLDIYLDGLLIRCLVLGMLAFGMWSLFVGKPH